MLDISDPIVQLLGLPQLLDGAADVSGESDLVAAANITALAESALSAESVLAADATRTTFVAAAMSVQSSLVVAANIVAVAASIVIGSSDLQATSTRVQFAVPIPMSETVVGTFTCSVAHPVAARPLVASSSLTGTIYTNPRLLVLPTVEYAYTDNVLLERYPIDNGQALLITAGVGELLDFPAQQLIADADYYFGGGRRVELTPEEEAAVVAAGYGEYIETEFLS